MCFYKTFYVAYELTSQRSYYVTQLACDFEMSCRLEAVPVVSIYSSDTLSTLNPFHD